jgi:hypothetical protein
MPTSSKAPRMWRGKPPHDGAHVAIILYGDETWHLWAVRDTTPRKAYLTWKLTSKGFVPHKCSYWFCWSFKEDCLVDGRARDLVKLKAGRPEVFELMQQLTRELVMTMDDPRHPEDGFEVQTYRRTPCTPLQSPVQGVQGGSPSSAPLSESTPLYPRQPPLSSERGAGERGGDEDSAISTSGDPDGDLL